MVVSYLYTLPTLKGGNRLLRSLAGGWQLNGIFTVQTGGPSPFSRVKKITNTGIGSDRASYLGGSGYGAGACGATGTCVNYLAHHHLRPACHGGLWQRRQGFTAGTEPDQLGYRAVQRIRTLARKHQTAVPRRVLQHGEPQELQQPERHAKRRRLRQHYQCAGPAHRPTGFEVPVLSPCRERWFSDRSRLFHAAFLRTCRRQPWDIVADSRQCIHYGGWTP